MDDKPNSGRKKRNSDEEIHSLLRPHQKEMINILVDKIKKDKDKELLKLYFTYMWGTPTQRQDITPLSSESISIKDLISFGKNNLDKKSNDDIDNFLSDLE